MERNYLRPVSLGQCIGLAYYAPISDDFKEAAQQEEPLKIFFEKFKETFLDNMRKFDEDDKTWEAEVAPSNKIFHLWNSSSQLVVFNEEYETTLMGNDIAKILRDTMTQIEMDPAIISGLPEDWKKHLCVKLHSGFDPRFPVDVLIDSAARVNQELGKVANGYESAVEHDYLYRYRLWQFIREGNRPLNPYCDGNGFLLLNDLNPRLGQFDLVKDLVHPILKRLAFCSVPAPSFLPLEREII